VQRWQVLQTVDPTTRIDPPPYERLPQVGTRYSRPWLGGIDVAFEASSTASPTRTTTISRRARPATASTPRQHQPAVLLAGLEPGAQGLVQRRLVLGRPAAARRQRSASRVIPTLSIDSAWALERDTSLFGKTFRETLEPRLFYVNTPFRRQDDLPNFDAFAKDFNFDSIFTENTFSGIDRVSDSHQLTAG
jgi:LPS-assembly protein